MGVRPCRPSGLPRPQLHRGREGGHREAMHAQGREEVRGRCLQVHQSYLRGRMQGPGHQALSDGTVETNEVEGGAGVEEERKKREADPEAAADADAYYGYGYGHGYYGYGAYHHPITQAVVTVKHHCVETPHKACITKPVTEEVENTVPHCVLEHSADCEDVEHKVPPPSASEEGKRGWTLHLSRSSVESQHIVIYKGKSLFLVKNLNEFIYIKNKLLNFEKKK